MAKDNGPFTNAPAVSQEFNVRSSPPAPVSKMEVENLKKERENVTPPTLKPAAPAPPGMGSGNTTPAPYIKKEKETKQREALIQYMEGRLNRQQGRAQEGFKNANVVPPPDPVSKKEAVEHKQEIDRRETRMKYIQQRLDSKRGKTRDAFDRSR
jgi:hypothetical protein